METITITTLILAIGIPSIWILGCLVTVLFVFIIILLPFIFGILGSMAYIIKANK